MTVNQRHVLVLVLSLGLMAILLILVSLTSFSGKNPEEIINMHEIQIVAPPPPPPPPASVNSARSSRPSIDLTVSSAESPAMMLDMNIDIPTGELMGYGSGDWGDGLNIDWGGFDLSELDQVPSVVAAPLMNYPDELLARGVKNFTVKLHILIDEQGETYLIKIIDNPYHEFDERIINFVASVRFTPPTLLGALVKAEFVWPVEFGEP